MAESREQNDDVMSKESRFSPHRNSLSSMLMKEGGIGRRQEFRTFLESSPDARSQILSVSVKRSINAPIRNNSISVKLNPITGHT